jgi:hypothetical protein
MAAPFDNIVQHLFHQPSLHSVTVDELQHMTQEHPYFAAAHFLLLKKMQDTAHPSFTDQLHRTTLYFNNPLWLQFLLQPELTDFSLSDKAPFIENEPVEQHEQHTAATDNAIETGPVDNDTTAFMVADSNASSNGTAHHQPAQATAEQDNMMDIITAVFSEPDTIQETHMAVNSNDETATDQPPIEYPNDNTATAVQDTNTQDTLETGSPQEDLKKEEQVYSESAPDFIHDNETVSGGTIEIPIVTTPTPDEVQPTTYKEKENILPDLPPAIVENSDSAEEEIVRDEPSMDIGAEEHDATEMPETIAGEENAGGDTVINDEKPLLRTIIETPAAKNDLLFEPYHTVDYFASQGIKLGKQETDPKDKLGRQLKSFTDWLKTMKKLPQVSIDKILAENEESKVVEDAIHSIENKEVITEAMAEVFEKQGMNDKAAEIYRKLSLLNPSKSAYFAARTEALKH